MFVSIQDTGNGPTSHAILADDGSLVFGGFRSQFAALDGMRTVWLNRAHRHGLVLDGGDLRYWNNSFTVDGMDPDEWIITLCCGDEGGSPERCVES